MRRFEPFRPSQPHPSQPHPSQRAKLAATLEDTLKNPAVHERLTKLGFEPDFAVIEDWPGRLAKEIGQMKDLAQKAGIKGDE